MKAITGGNVLFEGKFTQGIDVVIDGQRIAGVGRGLVCAGMQVVDVSGRYVVPGFVDLHMHGHGGNDVTDGEGVLRGISKALCRYGVTSYLPSGASTEPGRLRLMLESIDRIQRNPDIGAMPLGGHLEGIFISFPYKGAQNPEHILPPVVEVYQKFVAGYEHLMKLCILAPEMEGARQLAEYWVAKGVRVAYGHTGASYDQALNALRWGLTHATHLFNGMNPLHHRDPGVPGLCLTADEITCELIADCVHLHPAVLKLAYKAKGADKCCLVTDMVAAAGVGDGEYELGGKKVIVKKGIARTEEGNLAGSTLTMDLAVRNMIARAGVSPEDAIKMATQTPARQAGEAHRRGVIASEYVADIVVLDRNWEVVRTFARGEEAYNRAREA